MKSVSFIIFFKKVFDELLSVVAIIFLIPVFIIIAILIKLDDPKGPIFYSQIRIGRNGHPFKMYKFRSMVVNADKKLNKLLGHNEIEGAMFKMKSDPRVTRVVDELHLNSSQTWGYLFAKRSIDIIVSMFALIILSPVFLLIWIIDLCSTSNRGPLLYKQVRVGYHGKKIQDV